jgi:hypothetical protein
MSTPTPTLGSRYRRTPRPVRLRTHSFIAVEVTRRGRVIPLLDTVRATKREAMRAAIASDYRTANLDADLWCTVMRVGISGEVMAR